MNTRRVLLAIAGLLLAGGPAAADVNYTQGVGTVIFDFTCFTTKHCSAHVPINSSGVEIFTAAVPAQVSLANTGANSTPILTTASQGTGWPDGAIGAAVPSNAIYLGLNSGGNTLGWAAKTASTYTSSDVVPGVAVANTNANIGTNADAIAAAANFASPVGSFTLGFNGTTWDRLQVDGSKNLKTVAFTTNNVAATPEICGSYAMISMSTATTTEIVALSGSTNIHICDYEISANAATNITFKKGTGTNCGTGTGQIGQTWYATANWGKSAPNSFYRGLNAGASNALCVTSSQAVAVDIGVYYDRF